MKILAIGAHPDDIEIFMFGFLAICKNRGDKIYAIVATDGALGGKKTTDLIAKRAKETKEGLKHLCEPTLLGFPDSKLGSNEDHYNEIDKKINSIKPDLIVTHYKEDYHSDHRALNKIVKKSTSHYIPILYCDTMMGINFLPDYYIDISKVFKKINAISKHNSQGVNRFTNLVKIMNSLRAAQCNAPIGEFAEAYKFSRSFPFSDIRNYLPKSPKIRPFYIKNHNGFL